MDDRTRAILRDYAEGGLSLAQLAERHGLAGAQEAGEAVWTALEELDDRIDADLGRLYRPEAAQTEEGT